jgi:hypothetical protein
MARRIAQVPAQQGGRYVRQLASHWSHKFTVEAEGDRAVIHFPAAVVTLDADATGIAVSIDAPEEATAERLTDVVAKHLDRFAFREAPLSYDWRVG